MKFLFILLIFSSFAQALADASVELYSTRFEDTSEFLAPQFESNPSLDVLQPGQGPFDGNGDWGYVVELIASDGKKTILAKLNADIALKPASTQKLFTGWWAYEKGVRKNSYLGKMFKESVNSMAEATLELLGGVQAEEDFYVKAGLPLTEANFHPVDGSGLSYDNKVTPALEIKLLELIRRNPRYQSFKQLLAQPQRTGTLENRLPTLRGKVFAKTGTLDDTACLTGFMETGRGTVLFSIISNHLKISLPSARKKIDTFIKSFASGAQK